MIFFINSIIFPRIKSNQLTSHKSNLNDNNKQEKIWHIVSYQ